MLVPFLDLLAIHAEISSDIENAWRNLTGAAKFIGGEFVEQFEAQWAAFCGTRYCVGLSDGTAALELALRALDVGPGDEVIVPANTFFATWEAIAAVGAQPVPVDVNPDTLLMTADHVQSALTEHSAAVIAVHLYGQPVDMDAVNAVAKRAGIFVIEDAAQAHGATWRGQRAGGLSEIGCFSFYPGKNLGGFGDAGGVVTNRSDVADRIRSLSNHGRHRDAADHHIYVGNNRRLDALQAAILSAKMPHLERWNAARRRIAGHYEDVLAGLPIKITKTAPEAVSSHHLAVIQVPERDKVKVALAAEGISTGIHYRTPCHRQPAFAEFATRSMPVSERAANRILSLPMFPHLSEAQIQHVGDALRRTLSSKRLDDLAAVASDRFRDAAAVSPLGLGAS